MSKGKNIYQRINAIMADVETVCKETKKVNGQYKAVTHDTVTRALHKPCVKHGVVIIPNVIDTDQVGNRLEMVIEVDFVNMDDPSDKITTRSAGYGIDNQDKGHGKAYSYAFKMALLKTFMLESTEDDNEHFDVDFDKGKGKDYKSRGKAYRNKKDESVGGDI